MNLTETKRISRPFYAYARERYRMLLRRRAGHTLWTTDPILRGNRFCNVFREDDKTTAFFRENIRSRFKSAEEAFAGTIIFRQFNRISTAKALLNERLFFKWDSNWARLVLEVKKPVVTSAYMVWTPPGMSKLDGCLHLIDGALEHRARFGDLLRAADTLQEVWESLLTINGMGKFTAYEIVTDLRHTPWLEDASDIDTWANAGPGAKRGLARLFDDWDGTGAGYPNAFSTEEEQELMQKLLAISRRSDIWRPDWPRWEMRDVEHTLCEYDKYKRIEAGGRAKRTYP